ncbi:uncharacterized protein LOC125004574 isoform X4 [Mugil cephalus]|uniref:uncharacterized protein LOC125004574 isoform X4 n=1 Tax=Mugil cephalus TaxID=48193 RepID=UPI001FB7C309|nr:uncharacterized protein LOC125004574 isoform X4 [Mugil cephalus]
MEGLHIALFVISGVVSCSHGWISVPTLEVTARPGDNITLYCDCRQSFGAYTMWFRNCSHENQPTLLLSQFNAYRNFIKLPGFEFVKNSSTDSYDLLIVNVTDSDEGLYYCGTQKEIVEDGKYITTRHVYRYSNITTRLIVDPEPSEPHHDADETREDCGQCWKLLFCLCPAGAVLSVLLSGFVVHRFCRKSAITPQGHEARYDSQHQDKEGEDVCYAAVEIRQPSQRSKKRKPQSLDSSIYYTPSMC